MHASLVTRTLADYLRERSDLAAVYRFGSFARGTAGAASDVDLSVLDRGKPASTLEAQPFGDEAALAQLLARNVQVVAMNVDPSSLEPEIVASCSAHGASGMLWR